MKNKTAVQFGAGQIGRGFTGGLFWESGYDVIFVEYVQEVVDKLNQKGSYTLKIVGDNACELNINRIKAYSTREVENIGLALLTADIACTAVGVPAMPAVAPLIAEGIKQRFVNKISENLNILICENQLNGDNILRDMVKSHLPQEMHDYLNEKIGFALCVVSRMVPIATDEERQTLNVRTEAYKKLPVNALSLKGEAPNIVGLMPVTNFSVYIERKLFVHNASHAIVGYLGWLKGYEYAWQALDDVSIQNTVRKAMQPVLKALASKHNFPIDELEEHLDELIKRYQNKDLGDTNFRLGRDPLRKLRRDDRLIGAALMSLEQGQDIYGLVLVILAALKFNPNDDPSARKLYDMLNENGIEMILTDVCGLQPDEQLYKIIHDTYVREQAVSKK